MVREHLAGRLFEAFRRASYARYGTQARSSRIVGEERDDGGRRGRGDGRHGLFAGCGGPLRRLQLQRRQVVGERRRALGGHVECGRREVVAQGGVFVRQLVLELGSLLVGRFQPLVGPLAVADLHRASGPPVDMAAFALRDGDAHVGELGKRRPEVGGEPYGVAEVRLHAQEVEHVVDAHGGDLE